MLPLLFVLVCYSTYLVQSSVGNVASEYAPAPARGHRFPSSGQYFTVTSYQNCRCLPYETCLPVNGGKGYMCTAINSRLTRISPPRHHSYHPVNGHRFSGNHYGLRHPHYG
ncbi:uncharacterized protein LOC112570677 [Pomacea canaliculata]|uniref:uncharacterized protein LOC112570677 n=1 Tax=Pomacea canaliculata TaxID=400727 RepID=UPI000D738F7C|nr:uncharacterized protein LOC112570677 [Pomacea canaliculata]